MNALIRRATPLVAVVLLSTSGAFAFYNPAAGRWLNRDPIAERGGQNLYGFVKNEPIANYDILGSICAPNFSKHGCINFVGCLKANLEDFRVIPEEATGSLTVPSDGWNCQADGFWYRGEKKWFKVPDHCYVTITCLAGGGFIADCCCNGCASLIQRMRGRPHTCGWFPDTGPTSIHTDYPF